MGLVIFALSLIAYEIFALQEHYQNFENVIEGQGQGVEELDLGHSTRNDHFHIGDFFGIFAILEHTFTQKVAHIPSHTHTKQETWFMTIGKIGKVDLPKYHTKTFCISGIRIHKLGYKTTTLAQMENSVQDENVNHACSFLTHTDIIWYVSSENVFAQFKTVKVFMKHILSFGIFNSLVCIVSVTYISPFQLSNVFIYF